MATVAVEVHFEEWMVVASIAAVCKGWEYLVAEHMYSYGTRDTVVVRSVEVVDRRAEVVALVIEWAVHMEAVRTLAARMLVVRKLAVGKPWYVT